MTTVTFDRTSDECADSEPRYRISDNGGYVRLYIAFSGTVIDLIGRQSELHSVGDRSRSRSEAKTILV